MLCARRVVLAASDKYVMKDEYSGAAQFGRGDHLGGVEAGDDAILADGVLRPDYETWPAAKEERVTVEVVQE